MPQSLGGWGPENTGQKPGERRGFQLFCLCARGHLATGALASHVGGPKDEAGG